MSFAFRPATREGVGIILLLSGPSGGGKSFTAYAVAKGMAGSKRFAVVCTEHGRSRFYAEQFAFDVADLAAPFSPDRYREAIVSADDAGYPVIVVDGFSQEWAGEGGILEIAEVELKRMGGGANAKMASWIPAKAAHKKLIYRMLQCKAHLILTLRAEPKVEMVKEDGKMVVREKRTLTSIDGWCPISEKNLPFEATASALLLPDAPGVPRWLKLPEPLKPMFPAGQPITEECGRQLAAWAAGGAVKSSSQALATPDSPWRGILDSTTDEKAGTKLVYVIHGSGDFEARTMDSAIRAKADHLAGQQAIVEFTITAKGSKMITSIAGAM